MSAASRCCSCVAALDDLGLGKAVEDLAIQQFVAQLRVEALAVAILPRTSRFDEGSLCAESGNPFPNGEAVHTIGVTQFTFYRWHKEFGGLKGDQVKRLKELETCSPDSRRCGGHRHL